MKEDLIDKNGIKFAHDFVVEYKILSELEGGRKTLPRQGIKWDFSYKSPTHDLNKLFMIWPQFINEKGQIIQKTEKSVPICGKARMWIVNDKMRKYHQDKIHVGLKAYAMEGNHVVANYLVTEIVGLITNPIK